MVAALTPDQSVVAGIAINEIRAAAAMNPIVPLSTMQVVVALVAIEGVVAATDVDGIAVNGKVIVHIEIASLGSCFQAGTSTVNEFNQTIQFGRGIGDCINHNVLDTHVVRLPGCDGDGVIQLDP